MTNRKPSAFTLIELLVVIAIIGVLIALLLPGIQAARESVRRAQCQFQLTQLLLALHSYEQSHELLPPGVVDRSGPIGNVEKGYRIGWVTRILPYLEEKNLYGTVNFEWGAYADANATAREFPLGAFVCPSDWGVGVGGGSAPSSYVGSHNGVEAPIDVDNNGLLFLNSAVGLEDIPDGRGHTLLVGEAPIKAGSLGWISGTRATLRNGGSPINATTPFQPMGAPSKPPDPLHVGGFGSMHPTGANMGFADGSTRFISDSIDARILEHLANREDGSLVDY